MSSALRQPAAAPAMASQGLISHLTKAVSALQAGKARDGERHAKKALKLAPNNADCHLVMATALQQLGNARSAEHHYLECLRINPRAVRAMINLGQIKLNAQEAPAAVVLLEGAIQVEPSSVEARNLLARAYALDDRPEAAVKQFRIVEAQLPNDPAVLSAYGRALKDSARADAAVDVLKRALKIMPNANELKLLLADCYSITGQFDQGEALVREVLSVSPSAMSAYMTLSAMRRLSDEDAERTEKIVEVQEEFAPQRTMPLFALAAHYGRKKDFDRSFAAYYEANEIRNRKAIEDGKQFQPEAHARNIEVLKALMTADKTATWPEGHASDRPVFIVGMPRSGTTLTEQILAAHPEVYAAGERATISEIVRQFVPKNGHLAGRLPNITSEQLKKYARYYLESLEDPAARSARRITDKMPLNAQNLSLIARMFPNAAIVLCRRHPMDVCWSNFQQNFKDTMVYSHNLENAAYMTKHINALMDHWFEEMPARTIEVFYEDLVTNFEPGARRLVAHAGLDWHDNCLEFHKAERVVHTASQWQVRQPVYNSAVSKWKPYEQHLSAALDILSGTITDYEKRLANFHAV